MPTTVYGSAYGGWIVYDKILTSDSVVYSVGVGEDASFDRSLIEKLGVTVHAFDPTPRSKVWVREQSLPAAFVFHAVGAADFDGTTIFHAPENPLHASYTLLDREGDQNGAVMADVQRISSMARDLGHNHIDLLKLDIEGAEYGVLRDVLESKLDVRQILVEFHHRFRSVPVEQTKLCLANLRAAGYAIYYVSPRGEEFSFVRRDAITSEEAGVRKDRRRA